MTGKCYHHWVWKRVGTALHIRCAHCPETVSEQPGVLALMSEEDFDRRCKESQAAHRKVCSSLRGNPSFMKRGRDRDAEIDRVLRKHGVRVV